MECPQVFTSLSLPEFEKVFFFRFFFIPPKIVDSSINELILEKGNSYLGLIPSISSYSEILAIKNFLHSLFERVVETNCTKAIDLDKLFDYEKLSLDADKSKTFKRKIFENIDIIKRRIIEKYIVMSEYYLVDFNWNVNVRKKFKNDILSLKIKFRSVFLQIIWPKFKFHFC